MGLMATTVKIATGHGLARPPYNQALVLMVWLKFYFCPYNIILMWTIKIFFQSSFHVIFSKIPLKIWTKNNHLKLKYIVCYWKTNQSLKWKRNPKKQNKNKNKNASAMKKKIYRSHMLLKLWEYDNHFPELL